VKTDFKRYLDLKADNGGKCAKRARKTIEHESSAGFMAQECQGIFYPVPLFTKTFGEPHPDQVKSVPFPTGIRVGVVMEDDGKPLRIGAIRMFNVMEDKQRTRNRLGDSDTAVNDKQLDDVEQMARSSTLGSMTASAKFDQHGSLVPTVSAEEKKNIEEDAAIAKGKKRTPKKLGRKASDASTMSEPEFCVKSWAPQEGTVCTAKVSRVAGAPAGGRGRGGGGGRGGGRGSGGAGRAPGSSGGGVNANGKRASVGDGLGWKDRLAKKRKLDQVESATLSAQQVLASFQDDATVQSVQEATVTRPLQKIEALLGSDLTQFLKNEQGMVTDEGEKMITELRSQMDKLTAVRDVAIFLKAKPEHDQFETTYGASSIENAKAVDVNVPPSVVGTCMKRHGDQLTAGGDWASFTQLLQKVPQSALPTPLFLVSWRTTTTLFRFRPTSCSACCRRFGGIRMGRMHHLLA
jgi:hypothetical protein